ncbi:MAG: SpoIIE family protein phosphatase, partial [Planctomycetales bacterium]
DGFPDAMNAQQLMFGPDRLRECIVACPGNPVELGRKVLEHVRAFTGDNTQFDDMCWVCFGRNF